MVRAVLVRATLIATLAALPGCAFVRGLGDAYRRDDGGLSLSFEDVPAPDAYRREGRARAEPPGGAEGLWAVVPDLSRPERAEVENLASGERVVVALYAGGGGMRLSAAAAAALGVGEEGARVRVTALRRQPRIAGP